VFSFKCKGFASYGCLYEYVSKLLDSCVFVHIISSLVISKNTPTIPFAFRYELRILLALRSRDKVKIREI
jgi:hypothetical protein